MELLKTLSKKWWVWIIVLPLLAWGLWYVYLWYDNYVYYEEYREQNAQAQNYIRETIAGELALKARYAADFDGGKTPEETWAMFVDALERGDTDEAAKYYIVEQQEEEKRNWAGVKNRGKLNLYLGDFEKIIGGSMYPDGNTFEFYTDDIDGGPGFVYILVKNPITGVWKIEDL